jgi:hypothetical protein
MPRISIHVKTDLVRQGLEDLFSEVPKIGRRRIRTIMERIKRAMQEYPPERTGQSAPTPHPIVGTVYAKVPGRYQRTGNLGSHWAIAETKNHDGYYVENTAERKGKPYGKYVVGSADGSGQAWMHKGRWKLFRDVTEQELKALPKIIRDEIVLVSRREGFNSK